MATEITTSAQAITESKTILVTGTFAGAECRIEISSASDGAYVLAGKEALLYGPGAFQIDVSGTAYIKKVVANAATATNIKAEFL